MQDDTNISRRVALQGVAALGASALVGGAFVVPKAAASIQSDEKSTASQDNVQFGFLVNTSNCVDCQECVEACRRANETRAEAPARRQVMPATTGSGQSVYVSTGCMQCESPACMTVCPAAAIAKDKGGIVTVDHEKCIGCKYCYQACPFGVPHYVSEGMDKCDCCLEAGVELGKKPYCVRACKFRALYYGTLDELMNASGGKARQIESPTGPSYLLQ